MKSMSRKKDFYSMPLKSKKKSSCGGILSGLSSFFCKSKKKDEGLSAGACAP